jgi:hypothetical protein
LPASAAVNGPYSPAGFDVGRAFSKPRVDLTALLGPVLIIRRFGLGGDRDYSSNRLELQSIARSKIGLALQAWWNDQPGFVSDYYGRYVVSCA